MANDNFRQRLDSVVSHVCEGYNVKVSNGNFFSVAMQMDNANYQRWLAAGRVPAKPMKLLMEKHGINPAWLNEGNGEMLLPNANVKVPQRLDLLLELLESLRRENAMLRRENAALAEEIGRLKFPA